MSDEEIIKRLEQCVNRGNRNYDTDIVLDLINRQKEEIKKLKQKNAVAEVANRCIVLQRDRRDREIEELHSQIAGLNIYKSKIKAEAYKEFAEKIKMSIKANVVETLCNDVKGVYNAEYVLDDIDNLLKEMVGEEE